MKYNVNVVWVCWSGRSVQKCFYVGNTSASGSPNVLGAFASTGILLWAAASKEPPILLAATAEASPAASPCSLFSNRLHVF